MSHKTTSTRLVLLKTCSISVSEASHLILFLMYRSCFITYWRFFIMNSEISCNFSSKFQTSSSHSVVHESLLRISPALFNLALFHSILLLFLFSLKTFIAAIMPFYFFCETFANHLFSVSFQFSDSCFITVLFCFVVIHIHNSAH